MKQQKILTIGGGTQDIFISYKESENAEFTSKQGTRSCLLLDEGSKIEVTNLVYATGGGATNAAVSFKRLGFSVATCCKLGKDPQAAFILEALKKESIDTTHIQQTDALPTGVSFILPSPNGNHTILAHRGANRNLLPADIPLDTLTAYNHLYITSLSGSSSNTLAPICKKAHELGIPVATNPGGSQLAQGTNVLKEALPYIDILILNNHEAAIFLASLKKTELVNFSIPDYCKQILKEGPRIVVVTHGKKGVYVASNNMLHFCPSIPTTVVSTVGAGDAFASCFVASVIQGFAIKEALIRGSINASSVISHATAKEGLLSLETLEKKAKSFDVSILQTFPLV